MSEHGGTRALETTSARRGALLFLRGQRGSVLTWGAILMVPLLGFLGLVSGPQEALMKQVASGPGAPYYQYAPDAASLQQAFQEIGNHLSKLRISK